jgi:hypothetical protein
MHSYVYCSPLFGLNMMANGPTNFFFANLASMMYKYTTHFIILVLMILVIIKHFRFSCFFVCQNRRAKMEK